MTMTQNKQNKQRPWWKCIFIALVLLIVIVGVPIGINECYKANTGYITVWNGADVLSYYGAIIASAGAAIGVYLSIKAANKNYQDDVRARTLPFIAVTPFERKATVNTMALLNEKIEKKGKPENTSDTSAVRYEEYKLNRIFFVITSHGIEATNKLEKKQQKILDQVGNIWVTASNGGEMLQRIDYYSLPLEIENVGNGTAVNFRVGFNGASRESDHEYVRPMMLKQGQTLYIHIFSTEKYEIVRGNYLLEFYYEDIYGNKYVQKFPVTFDKDKDDREFQSIDLVGKQTYCLGDDTNANP